MRLRDLLLYSRAALFGEAREKAAYFAALAGGSSGRDSSSDSLEVLTLSWSSSGVVAKLADDEGAVDPRFSPLDLDEL